jgi:tRNA nucleotidyltransferase/poly(A) polymerase
MKIFKVGGCVRDQLLGVKPHDTDWLIVGATPEDVQHLVENGYEQVGKDFPVFLHPVTHDEYALARIERKVSEGHCGFETFTSPDLTVEDDLKRRDFTINAMAMDPTTGEIVDPFGGQEDLKNHVIRHVSDAFSEDPLRVLRAVRFHAKYNFEINEDTAKLIEEIVKSPEFLQLSNERVWDEFEKILNQPHTISALSLMKQFGIFDVIFDGCFSDIFIPNSKCFNNFSAINKFVTITKHSNLTSSLVKKCRFSSDFVKSRSLFLTICDFYEGVLKRDETITPEVVYGFITAGNILRNESRFNDIKPALILENYGFLVIFNMITESLTLIKNIDNEKVIDATGSKDGQHIAEAIKQARLKAINESWKSKNDAFLPGKMVSP